MERFEVHSDIYIHPATIMLGGGVGFSKTHAEVLLS